MFTSRKNLGHRRLTRRRGPVRALFRAWFGLGGRGRKGCPHARHHDAAPVHG